MSIDGTASVQFQFNDRRSVGLNSNVNIPINPVPSAVFADGAGALQANQVYSASRALSGGADSLDLTGTALKDAYGTSVALARVKAIYLKNTSTHSMTFGADANAWATLLNSTGTITLPAGAFIMVCTPDATGWAVTAGTGDILAVTGTGTDTYDVAIVGATT